MIRILLILAVIYLLFRFMQWFATTAPLQIRQRFKTLMLVLLGGTLVLLAASGRLNWMLPLAGGVLAVLFRSAPYLLRLAPQIRRYWAEYQARRSKNGSASVSTVETAYLRMRLDHDSGDISGEVIAGRFTGRPLARMEMEELTRLLTELRGLDRDSAVLLESYLNRVYPDGWEDAGETGSAEGAEMSSGPMGIDEACRVLGLPRACTREQVVAAHRRLMQKLHPDRGGSDYLAAKINQAKDVLMKSV